jgi:protein tyrosine phosphatase (PTP) superfamily phosphohydrolase (DUF442 family)
VLVHAPAPACPDRGLLLGGSRAPLRRFRRYALLAVAGFVGFLVLGNLTIVAASLSLRGDSLPAPDVRVDNFRVVDDQVWRGAAPSAATYRDLAAAGATTVVDLRAEDDLTVDTALLDDLGITRFHLPFRDGQIPSQAQVDHFLGIVRNSNGPVFVHCGAGVGRTGAMVAAYLVRTGEADGVEALRRNLSVGPPSLEQVTFAATLEGAHADRVPAPVVIVSRVLDAPRRLWSRYGL